MLSLISAQPFVSSRRTGRAWLLPTTILGQTSRRCEQGVMAPLPFAAGRGELLPAERGARARSGWPRCQHGAAPPATGAKVGTSRGWREGWMRRGSGRLLPRGHGPTHTYIHIYTHISAHTAPVTLPPHAHTPPPSNTH